MQIFAPSPGYTPPHRDYGGVFGLIVFISLISVSGGVFFWALNALIWWVIT